MMTFHSVLTLECDVNSNEKCWGETHIYLEEGEKKKQAIPLLVNSMKWIIEEDGTCICPYCNLGIEEKDYRLRRVK